MAPPSMTAATYGALAGLLSRRLLLQRQQLPSESGGAALAAAPALTLRGRVLYYYRFLWPLTLQSVPTWTSLLVSLTVFFYLVFFRKKKLPAIVRGEQKKCGVYKELMAMVLDDVKQKEVKAREEGKSDEDTRAMSGLPEASRVFALLWDDVQEVRSSYYGIDPAQDPNVTAMEGLMRRVLENELCDVIKRTEKCRGLGLVQCTKDEAECFSGEKLKEKLKFARKVKEDLGGSFVNQAQLTQGDKVMLAIRAAQRKNERVFMRLMRPVLPSLLVAVPAQMMAMALQTRYYQISAWSPIGEYAAEGNNAMALHTMIDVGVGHLLVWFFEQIRDSWSQRAQGVFGQSLRNGVLKALVQQDFEYFDKNPSGALQERLNRDAAQLSDNFIDLPQTVLGQLSKIIFSMIQVWFVTPKRMFYYAIAPLPLIAYSQYRLNNWIRWIEDKGRKLGEEAAASTAEVLREIKTVRQFANERREAMNYARNEAVRNELKEDSTVAVKLAEKMFGVIIVGGLLFTMHLGCEYVQKGLLNSRELFDITLKLNFWVVFPTKDLISIAPKIVQVFEPLGRVCDLLDSNPRIEPKEGPHKVVVRSESALRELLDRCTTRASSAKTLHAEQIVLNEEWAADGGEPVPKGSVVVAHGPEGDPVFGKQWLLDRKLAYPLEIGLSRKKHPPCFDGRIEFEDVHFSYPTDLRKQVLKGLTFTVNPGQKVALVGEAGCGKSTCMSLLQRLYEPSSGTIRIDGVPIQDYDVHFLRSRMVLVDQKSVLFAATVRDNITYGLQRPDVSDEEVIQTLREASMWEGENCIESKPDKLLTKIGAGGISLSGGQTQRVAIARAMIRNPDAILLDEATSALDNKNEKIVQEALDKLAHRGSSLVIAHRLTTIKDADKIVVLLSGRVAEEGTHADLLEREIVKNDEGVVVRGIYRNLWELGFGEKDRDGEMAQSVLFSIASSLAPCPRDAAGKGSPSPSPGNDGGAAGDPLPRGASDDYMYPRQASDDFPRMHSYGAIGSRRGSEVAPPGSALPSEVPSPRSSPRRTPRP